MDDLKKGEFQCCKADESVLKNNVGKGAHLCTRVFCRSTFMCACPEHSRGDDYADRGRSYTLSTICISSSVNPYSS